MIFLCGATGRTGGALVRELLAANAPLRCLVRDPERARAQFSAQPAAAGPGLPHLNGAKIDWVCGDFGDAAALTAAMQGVERVFVMSPVSADLATQQINVVRAAAHAGATRIVKLSGSSWTMQPGKHTSTGALHAEVETAIVNTGIAHTLVRPNVFMQGMLARIIEPIRQTGTFSLALDSACASFIDVGDIAAVSAAALLAVQTPGPVLDITGPRAYSGADIAHIASALTGQPVTYQPLPLQAALARLSHESAFVQRHTGEMLQLLMAGAAAGVTGTIERLCGRPGGNIESWLSRALVAP